MALARTRTAGGGESPNGAILDSWERCLTNYGLDPETVPAALVLENAQLRERQEALGKLLNVAKLECQNLYNRIVGSGYAILLTDADGVIVHYAGDPTLEKMFMSAGLRPGAVWVEERVGTNGIGTAMAKGGPVTVHRSDHFYTAHTGLTCSGAPIFDGHGKMIAVLDASSVNSRDSKESQYHTLALVNMSARRIEDNSFLHQYRNTQVVHFHDRPEAAGLMDDAMIAVDEAGYILAANRKALSYLDCANHKALLGLPIVEVLDLKPIVLAPGATQPSYSVLPVRRIGKDQHYFARLRPPAGKTGAAQVSFQARSKKSASVRAEGPTGNLSLKELAGSDPRMTYNVRLARRILNKDICILLQGQTGTGKEAVARAIHQASARASKPFAALNCASIPDSLIESELFGYKHGAFTGARREGMRGKILQSNSGTLFLDEIGDMPLAQQTRLLRVMDEREVFPLGSDSPVRVEFHVMSATHSDLSELVEQGKFREDLYYRINGITLTLPPLREREDKDSVIACALAQENDTGREVAIEDTAFSRLMAYEWPGNIRELRNVLRTALALSDDGIVRLSDLPAEIADPGSNGRHGKAERFTSTPRAPSDEDTEETSNPLIAAERETLLRELERNRWSVTSTAAQLNMSRNTVYRKLKKHGIFFSKSH